MNSPKFLKFLLVLSIIGSGMSFLGSLAMVSFRPYYEQLLALDPSPFSAPMRLELEMMLKMPRLFFAAQVLLYALSLTGVYFMWKLRSVGFHCYTIAQLLLLLLPLLFLGKGRIDTGNIMFTALFIYCYWRLLKNLGAFSENSENSENSESSESSENSESSEQ